ncbi:Uncharacterised protein [Burkholderia pseudomallei]|nr:Uncharacterised protein [Burkholderia pseudomallei]
MRGPCGTRRFVRGRQVSNRGLWASRAGRRRMIDIRSRSGRHRADRRRADVHARGGVEQRRATVRPADVARLGNARPGRRADGPPRTRACVCLAGGASRRCAARDTRHATRDTRHATRDTRHATRDTRHATRDTRHATRDTRHATRDTRHATRDTRHATRDTRHATRDTRHATRDTRHATRDTRHATCDSRHAPCGMRRVACGVREAACPAPADSMRGDAGRRREGDALAACVEPRAAALADSIEPICRAA